MAKLYAEVASDKSNRIASKGGNDYIDIYLKAGNSNIARLKLRKARASTWEEPEGDYVLETYHATPERLAIIVNK